MLNYAVDCVGVRGEAYNNVEFKNDNLNEK